MLGRTSSQVNARKELLSDGRLWRRHRNLEIRESLRCRAAASVSRDLETTDTLRNGVRLVRNCVAYRRRYRVRGPKDSAEDRLGGGPQIEARPIRRARAGS